MNTPKTDALMMHPDRDGNDIPALCRQMEDGLRLAFSILEKLPPPTLDLACRRAAIQNNSDEPMEYIRDILSQRRYGGTPPMNPDPTTDAIGVASYDLFSVGERFRFTGYKTIWEVLEIVERGWIVGQYLPGSPHHHGHKHLIEWSQAASISPLNAASLPPGGAGVSEANVEGAKRSASDVHGQAPPTSLTEIIVNGMINRLRSLADEMDECGEALQLLENYVPAAGSFQRGSEMKGAADMARQWASEIRKQNAQGMAAGADGSPMPGN